MAEPNREEAIARLQYSRVHAPWMFATFGALSFAVFGALLFRASVVGTIVGVSFGLFVSRLYLSVVDGLLVLLERDP